MEVASPCGIESRGPEGGSHTDASSCGTEGRSPEGEGRGSHEGLRADIFFEQKAVGGWKQVLDRTCVSVSKKLACQGHAAQEWGHKSQKSVRNSD